MENSKHIDLVKHDSPEVVPPLIEYITAGEVAGFDSIEGESHYGLDFQDQPTGFHHDSLLAMGTETAAQCQSSLSQPRRIHSVSISMPSSPMEAHSHDMKQVLFRGDETILSNNSKNPSAPATSEIVNDIPAKQAKFYSQPMPRGCECNEVVTGEKSANYTYHSPRDKLNDKIFDSFKTWSGRLERQLSHLRGKPCETEQTNSLQSEQLRNLPADQYFYALQGPELDTLRASQKILLPEDKKWPFLLRYPISSFSICLGVSSQAIMWKTLATSPSTKFLHISLEVNLILWCISVALVIIVSSIYCLKVIFYFEAVRREYCHPIRINFFFAPWIALLFLTLGVPPSIAENLHAALWYILMTPIFCLELKIYGQWMSGGQRRLSKVANPSNHLSIVGNFVGALLGASMGLKEGPIFFFAVGLAHYTVLFVTLYQRLPTNETLPKALHPVFFLFVAAPSVASMAWEKIQGSFGYGSRIAYFIALFLYFSLAARVNFFRGFRFSLAWWAYAFPMTGAAIATNRYSNEVTNIFTKTLCLILSAIATLTMTALLITTIIHAFVLRDLFPNDIAIAIRERKPKTNRTWFHWRSGSSDAKEIENYLRFAGTDSRDIEASSALPNSTSKVV